MRRRLPGSSSLDRVRWAVNPKDATRTPAAPVYHPDSAVGHARDDASRSESTVVVQSGRRRRTHGPTRRHGNGERERDASCRTGHSTNRTGVFFTPSDTGAHAAERGETARPTDKKRKKRKRERPKPSQHSTGGGERRVGKKADVTVSANQPLPVFALPTGDDHHSQLKRTHQYV
jgi:hypothetical protein